MTPPRPAPGPTPSFAAAAVFVAASALFAGLPTAAMAVCPVTSACTAAPFTSNPACCSGGSCTIDGNVTLPSPSCVWDFGSRNVTLSGTTTINASILELKTTGMLMVAGSAKVLGTTGTFLVNAGNTVTLAQGTLIEMSLSGDIEINGSSITAQGQLKSDAGFGNITLEAHSGSITFQRPNSKGLSAHEGSITLRTDVGTPSATILVNTPVGAEGGDVDFEAAGKVEVQQAIEVGNLGDGAGDVALTSLLNDVVVNGKIIGSDPGDGGTATLDAARDVIVTKDVLMRGESGGSGGDITISAGRDALIQNGVLDVSGTGGAEDLAGDGGIIDVAAGRHVNILGPARLFGNAGGSGTNGGIGALIDLDAGSRLLGLGAVAGNLTIAGQIFANGHSPAGNEIALGGCQVTIPSGGRVDATGDTGSTTLVIARTGLTIAGRLQSNLANVVELPAGGAFTTTGATITPATTPGQCQNGSVTATACRRAICVADDEPEGCLDPCPACGNGVTEYPEQCDGGAANRCASGCSPLCTLESCQDDSACTDNACDPVGGCYLAGFAPNGTTCDDDTVCNGREECRSGLCQVITGSDPTPCADDGNPCTAASCDAVEGCVHEPTPGPGIDGCDDGNACTGAETCTEAGVCMPGTLVTCDPGFECDPANGECVVADPCTGPADCDDGIACTADDCVEMICVNTPLSAGGVAGCDDGDACNGVETCNAGACMLGSPPSCNDGDPCTTETCIPASGCTVPQPIDNCCQTAGDCTDDGNACTAATCVDRQCGTSAIPDCCLGDAECDDGNACTPGATCVENTCQSTPPPDCTDDGNLCTDDFCDPVAGCVHVPVPGCCRTVADCDDGTTCTTDSCDPDFHVCSNVQEDETCVACDPADVFSCSVMGACADQTCVDGACVPQAPPDCDDGDDCTDDSCEPADGCQNLLRSDDPACTDIACTTDAECADTDRCTVDTCDASGTCRQTPMDGVAAVSCRLDGCDALLAGAGDDLVSKKTRKKIQRKLAVVRKKLTQAQAKLDRDKSKAAAARYKVAGKQLAKLGKLLQKQRGKSIDDGLAGELIALAAEAEAAIGPIRSGLGF